MSEQQSEVRGATTRRVARGAARYGVGIGVLLALAVLPYPDPRRHRVRHRCFDFRPFATVALPR